MMNKNSVLLYGANGYTGELIARYSKNYNLSLLLGGRNKEKIEPLATKLNLPYVIIDLNDKESLIKTLEGVNVIINAAGPFQFTARQTIDACILTGTHYIDINGDISVFEMIKKYDEAAQKAGIMLLPGAGFDVVPTDCIALELKKKMPDAVSIKLAFATLGGGLSHGTATTMSNKLGEGGAVRKNGKIIRQALGKNGMVVDFGLKKLFVMSIPWGDISTAYFTTGIPEIESYTGMKKKVYYFLKFQPLFNWLLRTGFVRRFIQRKIEKRPAGPSDQQRSKSLSLVWGEVSDAKGNKINSCITTPDGYNLSAYSCLLIAQKIINGIYKPGYQTPASAYTENLVYEIPGVQR
jgi:short subunit dehydrogenase-like uncharacterized protein